MAILYYFSFTGIAIGLTSAILGLFVYYRNPKNIVNQTYAFFNLSVFFWAIGYIFWPLAADKATTLYWFRVLHIGAIFVPLTFFHFTISFLGIKRKFLVKLGYILGIFFLVFDFNPLFIQDMRPVSIFKFWGVPGPLYHLYLIMYHGYAFYACYLLYKEFITTSDRNRKNQLRYMFIGMVMGYCAGSSNYILFYKIPIPPFANILGVAYVAMAAYAIVAYRLMDIEVIIKKTLVFAGLLASVFGILILPTLIIQEYLLRAAGTGGRLVGLTISGIIIILTVRRIETFLVNVTDKYLFQKKYDYKELLKTFTGEVLTVLELDNLVNLTVSKLTDIIKLNSCAVLLFDSEKQQFNVMASHNIKDSSITLIRPDGIVTFLEQTHGYLLMKDLAQKHVSIPASIQEIIDKLNAELIIPMVLHDDVIGVLSLGKKKSDEDYTQDDLDILLPLARTLAIAISNAQLFVELGKTQAEAAQKEKMAVIGTLSAGINHEICNPLGIARGQCEAFLLNIKDGLYKSKTNEELIEKAKDIMAKVMKETDRATAITKKLSSFAKPAKGEAELIDITKEVDEVLGLVGYELKLEKIEIVKDIDKNLSGILVDRKQFQEVLFNLIRNAGQAIGEKGKVTITAKDGKGKVCIDIKDTGSGIPEDKVKQLFNPFFTTKEPGKGTGLGLFIVRQVVEKNGGRISLKGTKVGEGTTFMLEFPAAVKQEAKVS